MPAATPGKPNPDVEKSHIIICYFNVKVNLPFLKKRGAEFTLSQHLRFFAALRMTCEGHGKDNGCDLVYRFVRGKMLTLDFARRSRQKNFNFSTAVISLIISSIAINGSKKQKARLLPGLFV